MLLQHNQLRSHTNKHLRSDFDIAHKNDTKSCLEINCVVTIVAEIGESQNLCNSTPANYTKQVLTNYFLIAHNLDTQKTSWEFIV